MLFISIVRLCLFFVIKSLSFYAIVFITGFTEMILFLALSTALSSLIAWKGRGIKLITKQTKSCLPCSWCFIESNSKKSLFRRTFDIQYRRNHRENEGREMDEDEMKQRGIQFRSLFQWSSNEPKVQRHCQLLSLGACNIVQMRALPSQFTPRVGRGSVSEKFGPWSQGEIGIRSSIPPLSTLSGSGT